MILQVKVKARRARTIQVQIQTRAIKLTDRLHPLQKRREVLPLMKPARFQARAVLIADHYRHHPPWELQETLQMLIRAWEARTTPAPGSSLKKEMIILIHWGRAELRVRQERPVDLAEPRALLVPPVTRRIALQLAKKAKTWGARTIQAQVLVKVARIADHLLRQMVKPAMDRTVPRPMVEIRVNRVVEIKQLGPGPRARIPLILVTQEELSTPVIVALTRPERRLQPTRIQIQPKVEAKPPTKRLGLGLALGLAVVLAVVLGNQLISVVQEKHPIPATVALIALEMGQRPARIQVQLAVRAKPATKQLGLGLGLGNQPISVVQEKLPIPATAARIRIQRGNPLTKRDHLYSATPRIVLEGSPTLAPPSHPSQQPLAKQSQ